MNNLAQVAQGGQAPVTLKSLLSSGAIKKRFAEVLGARANQFLASVLGAVNTNPALAGCDPMSVMASAMVAATLDLEVVPSFGFSALVPYKGKVQFQIMSKGLVQLAMRSGQFKSINVGRLYKDEILGYDPIKGTFEIAQKSKMRASGKDEDVAGYFCYFSLINGFEKTEYWTIEEIVAHGKRYSQTFSNKNSQWQTNFEAMAKKTVLKNTLSKYAPLSTQLRTAIVADQGAFKNIDDVDTMRPEYVDNRPTAEVKDEGDVKIDIMFETPTEQVEKNEII